MGIAQGTMLAAIGGSIIEERRGYAKGILPLSEGVMQPTRVFHAGAIVTLADEVASRAIYNAIPKDEHNRPLKFPYSVQLSVNLLTNDPIGPLTAESTVSREGGLTLVDTVVTTHDGKTAALMRSVHKMVDPAKAGPHLKA
ncbi:MAG: PaaI family thioesterase [Candidatus Obscuribacterales bacterium]|nr:PaaI family thioesterase [Candidatus Obscuribacterales bacterium]